MQENRTQLNMYGKSFKIYTDHLRNTLLVTKSSPHHRVERWMMRLQLYEFDMKYKPGSQNILADFLSRLQEIEPEMEAEEDYFYQLVANIETVGVKSTMNYQIANNELYKQMELYDKIIPIRPPFEIGLLNITFQDEDPDNFIIFCDYFNKLNKFCYIENHDTDCETSLIKPGGQYLIGQYLIEQCFQFLRDEFGFEALFERPEFVAWTLSEEYLLLQTIFYRKNDIKVSKRATLALSSTDLTDMYLYEFIKPLGETSQRTEWVLEAYRKFIDLKNDKLLCENKIDIDEFPIKGSILKELIEFWTHYYACNTIRWMITILHQLHIYTGYPKFTRQGRWSVKFE